MNHKKSLFVTITFLFLTIFLFSQSVTELYKMGVDQFRIGNLQAADSLFTEAIDLVPDNNTYFNRGMVRKAMSDTCGYCDDMLVCYDFFSDDEAIIHFSNDCIKWADTVYISNKNKPIGKNSKYRYFDVFSKQKCYNEPYGVIYSKKRKYEILGIPPTSKFDALNLGLHRSNIYATYHIVDSTRIYYNMAYKPSISCKVVKESKAINQVRSLIFNNQPQLKEDPKLKIPISVIINANGEIVKVKCDIKELNKNQFENILKELQSLLVNYYNYPKGKIFGEFVSIEYFQFF